MEHGRKYHVLPPALACQTTLSFHLLPALLVPKVSVEACDEDGRDAIILDP